MGSHEEAHAAPLGVKGEDSDEDLILDFCAERLIPYTVTWELTHTCNLQCGHCYCPPPAPGYWTAANVASTLNVLYRLGVFELAFTGGECTTHPEFDQILELAYEKDFIFSILSNGLLITEERARRLSRLPPRFVQLSIYSLQAHVHDQLTGVSGSFEATMRAFRCLREYGVRVNIACTVFKANAESVLTLADWAEREGVEVTYGLKISPSENPAKHPMEMRPERQVVARLLLDPRVNPFLERCQDPGFLGLGEGGLNRPICQAGFRNLCLSAQGLVYPCNTMPMVLGDVREQTVEEIWAASEQLQDWRKVTRRHYAECSSCKAVNLCEPCPAGWFREHGTLERISVPDCDRGRLLLETTLGANGMAYP